jgi:hypothetical protein
MVSRAQRANRLAPGPQGKLAFHALPTIVRVLERHGRSLEGADDTPPEAASEQPVLASCDAASARDAQDSMARGTPSTPLTMASVSIDYRP